MVPFGVFVGRFQPPHAAHVAVMVEALRSCGTLIVVLGSARAARTPKNPLTVAEREALIRAALRDAGADVERVRFTEVRDMYDMPAWTGEVRDTVLRLTGGAVPALYGHEKDASSAYLRMFPDWAFVPARVRSSLSATPLRRAWFDGDDDVLARGTSPVVFEFLRAFRDTPDFRELRADDAFLLAWREQIATSPARAFVAVHAVARHGGRVLLRERVERPGRGLLALPGGLLTDHDDAEALVRNLTHAQTGVTLPRAPAPPRSFTHPARSPLGREVALVHAFATDSAGTEGEGWWLISDALSVPERFYADHHRILEVMVR